VSKTSMTARHSRAWVDEPEGEEGVRGRRGCHGEPRRGRILCRGMVWVGCCRVSTEPRCRVRNSRETMKTSEPNSEPNSRAVTQEGDFMILFVKVVEGA
jgi:hypothetical protein